MVPGASDGVVSRDVLVAPMWREEAMVMTNLLAVF